jgi:tRNA(Arg) A34 adenosine deaminase TadA
MTKQAFMQRAVTLALEKMRANSGGPFGAVIVRNNRIISEGWNEVTSSNDPTAHAEIVAIRRACALLGAFNLPDCDIYTSCEPCPMCLGAIYWARLRRVYYANSRAEAAQIGFDDGFIYDEIGSQAARKVASASW